MLRTHFRGARSAVPASERQRLSEVIAGLAARWLAARGVRHLGLYAPVGAEVDLTHVAAALPGAQLAWPRVSGSTLEFSVASPQSLLPGFRGILEPPGPPVDRTWFDALLIPGLAFTRLGARLGSGGGYYDRFLAGLPGEVARLGVAFEAQIADSLPVEPHDISVHGVVTEAGVFEAPERCNPPSI